MTDSNDLTPHRIFYGQEIMAWILSQYFTKPVIKQQIDEMVEREMRTKIVIGGEEMDESNKVRIMLSSALYEVSKMFAESWRENIDLISELDENAGC